MREVKDKRIFLTERYKSSIDLRALNEAMLISFKDFYASPESAKAIRTQQFHAVRHFAADSGGFSFLIGKLQNPDPHKTIELYKSAGLRKEDWPIQLDLPPVYNMTLKERIDVITRSAMFFHQMRTELKETVPVVHGWSIKELNLSLQLLAQEESFDRVSASANQAEAIQDSIEKFHARIAAGTNGTSAQGYVMDNLGKRIAAGSNIATQINDTITKRNQKKESKRAPRKVVLNRLTILGNLLSKVSDEFFFLGAGSTNTMHLCFLAGASAVDSSSWRISAYLGVIFLPGIGNIAIGQKNTARRLKPEHIPVLKECLRAEDYPILISMTDFLELGSYKAKQFQKAGGFSRFPVDPFTLRALHNAWVVKQEEKIAAEYANDPDGYEKYLEQRFAYSPYLSRQFNYFRARLKDPFPKDNIEVFLRQATLSQFFLENKEVNNE